MGVCLPILPLLYVNLAILANRKAVLRARRGNPPDMRKSIRSSLVVAEEALTRDCGVCV